ncbi:nucleotide exchange factor GrpE [Candidatus Woesearchaeota archaeon]|nr:nucleotide exchange factor GrpE [Candidatus Woesearchaeota archaeon]|tara:strand:+ start:7445 stop:7927 length:483 start_codon:yes stop_codon:yes gene_type:complete
MKKEPKKQKEADYKDALQRLQAEFENYKKRVEKENTTFRKLATADVVHQMLPTLDSFEQALKNTDDKEKFVKGVELIYAQFHSMLEEMGLRQIKAAGERFDPYKHEVLLQEESDKDEIILEELQKGYMLNDMVIRHSKVKVGKKKSKDENKGGKDENGNK